MSILEVALPKVNERGQPPAVSELRPKRLEERCAGEILPGVQGFGYRPTVCSSRREGREGEWGDTATDRAGAQHGGSSEARAAGRARVSSCRPAAADRD